jgi:hypothetical protein
VSSHDAIAADLGIMSCTFCGRERSDGANLIQGPGVSICAECAATALQSEGYLVIPPGDTSPVGELVRAAVKHSEELGELDEAISRGWRDCIPSAKEAVSDARGNVDEAVRSVAKDHAVLEWVERGRG